MNMSSNPDSVMYDLGQLFYFSEAQFTHPENGDNNNLDFGKLHKLEII